MCNEDPNLLAEHYFNSSIPDCDLSLYDNWESTAEEINLEKFSPGEVWARLSSAENTAPGIDRLTFDHWRLVDQEAHTLSNIFTLCLKYPKIPSAWKLSQTVFIPKKDDCASIKDWCPISLVNTISKLFTECLTKWTIV